MNSELEVSVHSTSPRTAEVQDIPLSDDDEVALSLTRRILRAQLVDNIHSSEARVKATLMHQKRHSKSQPWRDADAFNLGRLRAGEEARLSLSSAETLNLYRQLQRLYAVVEDGLPQGDQQLIVARKGTVLALPQEVGESVQRYVSETPQAFWEAVNAIEPDLFAAVAITKVHEARRRAVEQFKVQLEAGNWTELQWDEFFRLNTWIFGHGLNYQFMSVVQNQANYGGREISGTGGQRGDFLMATSAAIRFTVLVDIKTPKSRLVSSKPYRNKTYSVGDDLIGGVSQLQSNCRTWVVDGSKQEGNARRLFAQQIETYEPRGILVVGHTKQLADDINMAASFELFRRNLHNPEIITYDELLARAEFIVSQVPDVTKATP